MEIAILGWGKGGKTLAGALGRAGKSVAVVERSSHMYGGSCININCVPTKALIHQSVSRPGGADAVGWFAASIGRRDGLVAKLRDRNHAMLAETPLPWSTATPASLVRARWRCRRVPIDW